MRFLLAFLGFLACCGELPSAAAHEGHGRSSSASAEGLWHYLTEPQHNISWLAMVAVAALVILITERNRWRRFRMNLPRS